MHPFVLLYACFSRWLQVLEKVCDSEVRVPRPAWPALRKWMAVLGNPKASAAARKKAIVAVARQLALNLWRLFTGQASAETLGLIYVQKRD